MPLAENFFDSDTFALDAEPRRVLRRRLLARDRLLGAQGCAPADRRPVARRDGGAAGARPAFPRADRLPLRPAARLDRGAARPRAGEPGARGAARRARPPLPGLPGPGRRLVPRLPRLHDAPQAGVCVVRVAARADLAGLPVLRDERPARERRRATTCCSRSARAARADAAATGAASHHRLGFGPYGHRNHTRPREAGRRPARPLRRDRRPFRAPRLRAARRPPPEGHPRRSRSSTTPSTRGSRSSASSSRSSPPAPSSPSPSAARTRSPASAR